MAESRAALIHRSMSKRQRPGNEDDAEGDAAADMAPERPRWFVVNAEEDTFTLNDAQEAARRADPTTCPILRKESYDFEADPAAHRKFLRTKDYAARPLKFGDELDVQQDRMLWCNAQRVSTQNVPGERVRYMDFYLAQPNHLGWDPTVGADGAADQGVVGILSQLTDALQEFEEDHNVDKLRTDAEKRADARTVTEQLQALEEADKAMLSGVGAQAWEYHERGPSDRNREGKEEDQNEETKTWWWVAPYKESFTEPRRGPPPKRVPNTFLAESDSQDAKTQLRNEHSTIVWETGGEEREKSAHFPDGERPKTAYERVGEALEGAMGSTVDVFPRLELLMEPHNCYTTRSSYCRRWQDAAPTVSTVVKLELLVRDQVKAAIDSIGQSFYGSPDLIDENSVLPAPRRGHKLLIAVLYTESLAARGVTKRAIGFHTYDPAAAKADESGTYLATRMQDVVNACAWV